MAAEYDINLSNGTVLSTLYPLEVNGPDNRSIPRLVQDARPQYPIAVANDITNSFTIAGDFVSTFRTGQVFEIVGSTGNDGTYTVLNSGFRVLTAAIVTGGTGYTLNDVLTITGGTSSTDATLTVTSVNLGEIDGVSLTDAGLYTEFPTNPVSVTGGTGSGATFNLTVETNTSIEVSSVVDTTDDGDIIVHIFRLNGDLAYRFISGFSFDLTNSGEIDGTYTVTAIGSVVEGLSTIIPVAPGSIRDNLIASIALPYGQIDYVNPDANTSLKLPGKGTMNYGEMIVENLVRMTENFANDLAPEANVNIGTTPVGDPLVGQLWYKTLTGQEGFLHYTGSAWTNNYDLDNGSLILRDPQNTTTANSDIYLTGDESQLPAGYIGTDESGMVIWNEVDPVARDAILRVLSVDGTERLRVEHDGYIKTNNNLEIVGGGNGSTESYFYGQVGIGDNGLPTIERTLTVEGNGIAINSDTGLHAGLLLDCPSITEQSIVEFEVANVLLSSIHTETNVRTVWESPNQTTLDAPNIVIIGGSTTSGNYPGSVNITSGSTQTGWYGGDINLTSGGTEGEYAGNINLSGGPQSGSGDWEYGGKINIIGGNAAGSGTHQIGGKITISGGPITGPSIWAYGGLVNINGGDGNGTGILQYAGDLNMRGGDITVVTTDNGTSAGEVHIDGGDITKAGSSGNAGDVSIVGGNVRLDSPDARPGTLSFGSGGNVDSTGVRSSGAIYMRTSQSTNGCPTGQITIQTGRSFGTTGITSTGNVLISTGESSPVGTVGSVNVYAGPNNIASTQNGSAVNITGGLSGGTDISKGGDVNITGGAGATTQTIGLEPNVGGDVVISGGAGAYAGANGTVNIIGNTAITGNVGINITIPTGTVDLDVLGDIKTGTVFLGGNGVIAAPTFSFTNDPNSGIFSAAADQLGFVTNGTNVFNIESDGTLSVNTASYETLVLADNDIPNKKYVDGAIIPQYEEYSAVGSEVIVNTTIPTTANTGSPGRASLQVFLNGTFQMEGAAKAYTVTGTNQITFNAALVVNDDVIMFSFEQ